VPKVKDKRKKTKDKKGLRESWFGYLSGRPETGKTVGSLQLARKALRHTGTEAQSKRKKEKG
jgi:hypothetical protein